MERPITLALIGAGNRGRGIFGQYALDMPHRARFTAVVEPDSAKRNAFCDAHGIPAQRSFERIEDFFAAPERLADGVIVATWENVREAPAMAAMRAGYHLLVEKPLGSNAAQVIRICDAAKSYKKVFIVCHQMRHVPPYAAIKDMVESRRFGKLVCIQHSENVSYSHMAHSFVRGFFNNDRMSPMIMAKSCHDMDMLRYLADAPPTRIASFGGLTHFKPENAPDGAPEYCLEGCPAYRECPYHVLKLYFGDDLDPAYVRQMGGVPDKNALLKLLRTNRFGRCVFKCDNNVVDHQVVQIEFANGVTAAFTMAGHNYLDRRMTKLSLTNGEIEFDYDSGRIRAWTFSPEQQETIERKGGHGTHGGGDRIIMDAFVDTILTGDAKFVLTPVKMSLDSHLMAFAAEGARVSGKVVDMSEFESKCRS